MIVLATVQLVLAHRGVVLLDRRRELVAAVAATDEARRNLLPVYAREILNVGATGLGILRGAPSAGAIAMAIVTAWWPLGRRAGKTLLVCVFGFGLFTIVFALSRNLWLSYACLFLGGLCLITMFASSGRDVSAAS